MSTEPRNQALNREPHGEWEEHGLTKAEWDRYLGGRKKFESQAVAPSTHRDSSNPASAQGDEAERAPPPLPDGTLHDDGCFTWKAGKVPPDRNSHAGWRADFYLAPVGWAGRVEYLGGLLAYAKAEVERLEKLLNAPEIHDFARGVVLEAAHQRDRWKAEHDAGKAPEDWFWLLGYLGGKALDAAKRGDTDKALHHCISSAAALANWHAALSGTDTSMRPGIDPAERGIEVTS
jgi:hypothetical protein